MKKLEYGLRLPLNWFSKSYMEACTGYFFLEEVLCTRVGENHPSQWREWDQQDWCILLKQTDVTFTESFKTTKNFMTKGTDVYC